MKRDIAIVYSLIVLTFLFSCQRQPESNSSLQVFRYNESKGITSLDPAFARNQTNIWPVSQMFNGLVQLDDSLMVKPSIAHSWQVDESRCLYTFYLRQDVYFHKSDVSESVGRRVTAKDFIYSFTRILDPEVASPGRWIFEYLSEDQPFVFLNDSVLQLSLKKPFPAFLSILAMPYCSVVPEEFAERADFGINPVGTGPFRFKYWSQEEKLILLRNEHYFEKDSLGMDLPYLDAVSITFIKDKQSEFLEFLKGNLDFLSGVHTAYKDELLTRSGTLNPKYMDELKLLKTPYLNTEYLGILQEEGKGENILLDRRIRLAINHGFDREKMMKYMRNNLGFPATAGMIPPGLPGTSYRQNGYEYNPDLARQLLVRSGYFESGSPDITLTTTSDYLDLCEFIQFELGKLGMNIKISVSTGGAYRNMVANGNLSFFRASWIADYADAENYLALFYSKNMAPAGPNYTRFSSQEYDKLYEQTFMLEMASEREKIYQKLDSMILVEAPVVPLYYDMVVRFTRSNLHGFTPNPMNNLVLKRVFLQ